MIPLFAFERRWLRAILDTIFPGPSRGGALPLGAADLDVDRFFDDMFAHVPFESALGLRAAIWFLALSPLFVLGRFTSFVGLSGDDRERVYLKLSASPVYVVRSLVMALKAIGSLLYCANATVRPRILGDAIPAVAQGHDVTPLVSLRVPSASAARSRAAGDVPRDEEQAASA